MSSKKKPVKLAEKISKSLVYTPVPFGSDDEAEETKAKIVDSDDEIDDLDDFKTEFSSAKIRRQNVGLLEETDKRYASKKVSLKQIFNQGDSEQSEGDDDEESDEPEADDSNEDDDSEVNDDNEVQESEEDELDADSHNEDDDGSLIDEEEESNEEGSEEESEEGSDMEDEFGDSIDLHNPLRRHRESEQDIKTMSDTNVRTEIEKGNCVREQLKLWENLLEMRIKIQKCLITSNKMPQHDRYKSFETDKEFKKGCKDATVKLSGLLNNLLQLQSNLLNNFPETKNILNKSKKRKANEDENESESEEDPMDEEIPSDTEDELNDNEEDGGKESEESENEQKKGPPKKKIKLSEFENILAKNHKAYAEYRNSVIQKWNDKTRIASGIISKGANHPAVKQIEFALANKHKLLKKTQLKRSEYDIIGKSSTSIEDNDGRRTEEYDTEIYDDDDFYHQLLRELIEYKSADITDPIQLSKHWIQLQNMRSKMKRKIDTRATKGRRIRYNVHQKLVNFMAPVTVYDTWTEQAKDAFYCSLFGKKGAVNKDTKSNEQPVNGETKTT